MSRFSFNNTLQRGEKYGFSYTCSKAFFLLSCLVVFCLVFKSKMYLLSWNIMQMGSWEMKLSFYIDWMKLLFFSVLCAIVSCVLKFSCMYMEKDPHEKRFTWMVLSFVFSMTCLIFIPNFFFLLVGWDGLGMTSFVLVIYYLSDSSLAAGLKTYLMNRMGDSFFIMGLVLFLYKGHWDMKSVCKKNVLALMMVLGCLTKSAQFPFSSWLPAAMAAPTPVSSLVHSSTLVTAGMYLMIRFCHMFPPWLFVMMGVLGMWTLYSASLAACCEYDSKKVVAYSTLSQLGLMAVAMSLKLPKIAFFHLITHAMFKALMFMCMGYLMHNSKHFQDLRNLNGVWSSNPLLGITLMISKFSLLGFPFLAGFFSKELMLENKILMMKSVFHLLLLFSLPLTSYYSCRLMFKVLRGSNYNSMTCNDDKKVLLFSLLPLFMGSLGVGFILSPWFVSISSMYPCHMMKFFVSLFIFSGVMLSWMDVKINKKSLNVFFGSMCFLVPFKGTFWKQYLMKTGSKYYYLLDEGAFSKLMKVLDNKMVTLGKYLHSSFSYFSHPKASYYVLTIVGISLFLGVMSWFLSKLNSFCFESKKSGLTLTQSSS